MALMEAAVLVRGFNRMGRPVLPELKAAVVAESVYELWAKIATQGVSFQTSRKDAVRVVVDVAVDEKAVQNRALRVA